MTTLLNQLQDSDAVLLMYLAGELPAEDAAEVEQMLHGDATLRQSLESLRATHDSVTATVTLADAACRVSSGFFVARSIGERIKPAEEKTASVDEIDPRARRRRMAMIFYPMAAAAVVTMGMTLWFRAATQQLNEPTEIVQWPGGRGDVYPDSEGDYAELTSSMTPRTQQRFDDELEFLSMLDDSIREPF